MGQIVKVQHKKRRKLMCLECRNVFTVYGISSASNRGKNDGTRMAHCPKCDPTVWYKLTKCKDVVE